MNGSAGRSRAVGEECVAKHVECTRLFFACCSTEGVVRLTDLDAGKAAVFEHLLPARTGQPAGNSAGPEVDVAQRLGWDGSAVGDVCELEAPAGLEGAVDLGEHRALVGTEVDDAVRDDDVGPAVFDGEGFGEPFAELDVVVGERSRGRARLREHLGGHVDADDATCRANLRGSDERVETGARADVDDAFTRRIDVIVDFALPDATRRRILWDQSTARLPRCADVDLDFVAGAFELSGGNIRSVAVTLAYRGPRKPDPNAPWLRTPAPSLFMPWMR